MAFTVQDFHDLIQLLQARPDWREELQRVVLMDRLLALPEIVRDLAEAQKRTEARLDQLALRVAELAEAQKRTEAQIAALGERMDRFQATQERMESRLGTLSGAALELRFAERAPAYLSRLALKVRVIPRQEFVMQAQDAIETGTLTQAEADSIARLDLLARGVRHSDRAPMHLAVEISETIRSKDVTRAARRAKLLERLYSQVIPVVAGEGISPAAKEEADQMGVAIVLDGRTIEEED
ncbi:MAG: hypothetical protein HY741_25050 [Chloroflexi bacterium]|nr:hypothetical protein [Chloroflexota bacterium]